MAKRRNQRGLHRSFTVLTHRGRYDRRSVSEAQAALLGMLGVDAERIAAATRSVASYWIDAILSHGEGGDSRGRIVQNINNHGGI